MKFGPMKPHRKRRLLIVGFVVLMSGAAVVFALLALNENINLFFSPEQVVNGEAPVGKTIRAGGMVVAGSVRREDGSLVVSFDVTDLDSSNFKVSYEGILPDLFREGQGVIALGQLRGDGVFYADDILAKHDENYMPPEVQDVIDGSHLGLKSAQDNLPAAEGGGVSSL